VFKHFGELKKIVSQKIKLKEFGSSKPKKETYQKAHLENQVQNPGRIFFVFLFEISKFRISISKKQISTTQYNTHLRLFTSDSSKIKF